MLRTLVSSPYTSHKLQIPSQASSLIIPALSSQAKMSTYRPRGHQSSLNTSILTRVKVSWGQGVKIIGGHPKLGSWELSRALDLTWSQVSDWGLLGSVGGCWDHGLGSRALLIWFRG